MIKRLLIANRGEIACRIIRAAHAMGIETVAVYSDIDADAQHVKLSDRAFPIGPAPAKDSYLNMEALIEAAKAAGADAVHPGYGFLSENAAFAEAVADAGLTFVGPTANVIALMGDKRTARGIAEKAGVPVVPGYDGHDGDDALLLDEARRIGVPLMIKATAGGGGRGLRRVDNLDTFMHDLHSARREAGSAFGNSGILLEKLIASARHVEVQVLADSHGNTVHLYERDCSSQRRHQKVIEEAPCATISDKTRAGLTTAAISLAKAVGYLGAGTVEFLVDNDGAFYFLEMNTRLQVEHPVTEMVTGIDLVAAQLRIASGEALGSRQDDVRLKGHAIEARLYAEDPAHAFMPQTGTLGAFDIPVGEGTRLDTGVAAGDSVSPYYDPMLAKLVAYGKTRDEARLRLIAMLRDSRIAGVATNKSWLKWLLHGDTFSSGAMRTHTLDQAPTFLPVPALNQAMGIALVLQAEALKASPLPALAGWRTLSGSYDRRVLEVDGERIALKLWQTRREGGWDITAEAEGQKRTVHFDGTHYYLEGEKARVAYCRDGDRHFADLSRWHFAATDITHAPAEKATTGTSGILTAPMDGQIVAVAVADGATVKAGDLVCVIEAMKMEHHIRADMDGTVVGLTARVGAQVKSRAPLAMIEPGENA